MEKDILKYHQYRDSHGRSWHGSLQKPISAKIDYSIMDMVDAEIATTGVTRNRLINLALKWYLTELDEARRELVFGS